MHAIITTGAKNRRLTPYSLKKFRNFLYVVQLLVYTPHLALTVHPKKDAASSTLSDFISTQHTHMFSGTCLVKGCQQIALVTDYQTEIILYEDIYRITYELILLCSYEYIIITLDLFIFRYLTSGYYDMHRFYKNLS